MKRFIPAIILGVFVLTGCGSLGTKIDDKLLNQYLTKSYDAPKAKCIDATVAALKEMNTGVEKIDRAAGTIITEKVPFYEERRVSGNQYTATGQSFVALHKYYFKFTGEGKQTTIQAYKYRVWQNAKEIDELNAVWTNENVWEPLFKEIQNQLDEM